MQVKIAQTEDEIMLCWPVMFLLRPHLEKAQFLPTIRGMQSDGYQLAFVEENGAAAAAIGYRYQQKLFDGKQIYVDDLTTLEEYRGKGYGGLLLDYVFDLARREGCACVTLDSGPSRHDAHRLYLNKGFRISSMHFTKELHK